MNASDTKHIRLSVAVRRHQIYNAMTDEESCKNRTQHLLRRQIISYRRETSECRKTSMQFWESDDCTLFESLVTVCETQYAANTIEKQKRQYSKHMQFWSIRWSLTSCSFDKLISVDLNDLDVEKNDCTVRIFKFDRLYESKNVLFDYFFYWRLLHTCYRRNDFLVELELRVQRWIV